MPDFLTSTKRFGPAVPGAIIIATDNPHDPIEVRCEQVTPALPRPPRPRWSTIDRPGRIGIPSFDGQDPYEILVTVRLDGFPHRSVEVDIATLEGFAEVPEGQAEPPVLTVTGAIPRPHPNIKWRLTSIEDPSEVQHLTGGKERCRYVTAITLTQHVAGDVLNENLKGSKAQKGLRTRTTRVQSNEDDLYAVARRYYGDPSRATDIARANFLYLGSRLTAGKALRMPV